MRHALCALLFRHQHLLRHIKAPRLQTIMINTRWQRTAGVVTAIPDRGVITRGLLRVDELAHFLADHVVNRQRDAHGLRQLD